jgi:hypothetical protein
VQKITRTRSAPIIGALLFLIGTVVAAAPASAQTDAIYLNANPETDINDLDSTHTITVTARDSSGNTVNGQPIDFEVTEGPNANLSNNANADLTCTTGDTGPGSCSVNYTDTEATDDQTDEICAWIDNDQDSVYNPGGTAVQDGGACDVEQRNETDDSDVPGADTFGNDATDVVEKTWNQPGSDPALLNTTPETATNARRTQHTITSTARDADGDTVQNAIVDMEIIDGPNTNLDSGADRTCTTGSNGTCPISYTDASSSTSDTADEICTWLDTDNDDTFNIN